MGGKREGAGRPRTLETPEGQEKVDRMISALRSGNFREVACEWAGIPCSTFAGWMREGEDGAPQSSVDFCRRVIEAEKSAEIHMVARVMKAAEEDPRHAQWWLARKFPERWADRQRTEVTGAGGGPVEHKHTGRLDLTGDVALAVVQFHADNDAAGGEGDGSGDDSAPGDG